MKKRGSHYFRYATKYVCHLDEAYLVKKRAEG